MSVECSDCGREFDTKRARSIHQTATHESEDKPYTDPDKLERLYWDEGLSLEKIADRFDTSRDRIHYWMDVHDIERRTGYAEQHYASYTHDDDHYEIWKTYIDGYYARVRVHRLLAVAEYGFDAVVDNDVHHQNGIRWDNRPENVQPMDPSDHRRHHGLERAEEQRELMQKLRAEGRLSGGDA